MIRCDNNSLTLSMCKKKRPDLIKKKSITDTVSGATPVDNKLASSLCVLYHSFLRVRAKEANY